MPSFIYRVMASMAAVIALCLALNIAGAYGVATGVTAAGFALLWMQEIRWLRFGAVCRPVGYGFALALLFYSAGTMWGRGGGPDLMLAQTGLPSIFRGSTRGYS